jgi:CheY-like chemotaxis protein
MANIDKNQAPRVSWMRESRSVIRVARMLAFLALAVWCARAGQAAHLNHEEGRERSGARGAIVLLALADTEPQALAGTAFSRALTNRVWRPGQPQVAAPAPNNHQTLVLTVIAVLTGILAVRKLPRLAQAVEQRLNPSIPMPAGATEILAENQSFMDFVSYFRSGPEARSRGRSSTARLAASKVPETGHEDPEIAGDIPLKESLAGVVRDVAIARNFLSELGRATDDSSRQKLLAGLLIQVSSLKRKSEPPALLPIWQMTSALEGLLKQLSSSIAHFTPSTWRTILGAVDVLETLSIPVLRPDLASNPPLRLLAVDDDAITRTAISAALKKLLNQPEQAANGEAALALADKQSYDLIFLDVEMPGMDGFELCTKIHQTPQNAKTPVVFVTGHSDFESRSKSTRAGGNDLIAKPFLAFEIAVKALTLVLRTRLGERDGGSLPASEPPPSLVAKTETRAPARAVTPVSANFSTANSVSDKAGIQILPELRKPSPDEFAKASKANSSTILHRLREQLAVLAGATDEKLRQETFEDMYLGLDALTVEAARAQLQTASRLAAALQAMFKKFLEQPARFAASALGVTASALDVLDELCAGGRNPDLANPPVRVLVVDDDPIACRTISATLQLVFKRPVNAGSGEAAVDLAGEAPFDLIFLDVLMPGMDGFEACLKIHETGHNRQTPVIFVTSSGDPGWRARASQSGGAGFIEKSALAAEITVTALTFSVRSRLHKPEATAVLEEAVC